METFFLFSLRSIKTKKTNTYNKDVLICVCSPPPAFQVELLFIVIVIPLTINEVVFCSCFVFVDIV